VFNWTGLKRSLLLLLGTLVMLQLVPIARATTSASAASYSASANSHGGSNTGGTGNCAGIFSPGYWMNYQNHYTDQQFASVVGATLDFKYLVGATITATVQNAEGILSDTAGDSAEYVRHLFTSELNAAAAPGLLDETYQGSSVRDLLRKAYNDDKNGTITGADGAFVDYLGGGGENGACQLQRPTDSPSHTPVPPASTTGPMCPSDTIAMIKQSLSYTITHPNGTVVTVSTLGGNVRQGDTVVAHFTIAGPCAAPRLSLASYKAPRPVFDANSPISQTLYASDTGAFAPGTHALTVSVPGCDYQVDFVTGGVLAQIGPAGGDNFYGSRLIEGANGGENSCAAATPTSVPPAATTAPPTATPCPDSGTLMNGTCVPPTSTATKTPANSPTATPCPDSGTPMNGKCVPPTATPCPASTVLMNGACVPPTATPCPDSGTPMNGKCVPPTSTATTVPAATPAQVVCICVPPPPTRTPSPTATTSMSVPATVTTVPSATATAVPASATPTDTVVPVNMSVPANTATTAPVNTATTAPANTATTAPTASNASVAATTTAPPPATPTTSLNVIRDLLAPAPTATAYSQVQGVRSRVITKTRYVTKPRYVTKIRLVTKTHYVTKTRVVTTPRYYDITRVRTLTRTRVLVKTVVRYHDVTRVRVVTLVKTRVNHQVVTRTVVRYHDVVRMHTRTVVTRKTVVSAVAAYRYVHHPKTGRFAGPVQTWHGTLPTTEARLSVARLDIWGAPVWARGFVANPDGSLRYDIVPAYGVTRFADSAPLGQPGLSLMSGHDDIDGSIFRYLGALRTGDTVVVTRGARAYRYVVRSVTVVTPDDVRLLNATYTRPTLALISCTPYLVDTHRVVVIAQMQ